jgi:hypothetical protein
VAFSVEKAVGGSVSVLVTISEVVVVGPLVVGGIITPPELVEVVELVGEVEVGVSVEAVKLVDEAEVKVEVSEEVSDWDVVVPLFIGNRATWGKAIAAEAIPRTIDVSQTIVICNEFCCLCVENKEKTINQTASDLNSHKRVKLVRY